MTIGLTGNPTNDKALAVARTLHDMLRGRCKMFLDEEIAKGLGLPGAPLSTFDGQILISIGGDGTLIRAAGLVNAPILGVKAGGVGFLTEVDPEEGNLDGAMERVLNGAYFLEPRMMLASDSAGHLVPDALNDLVVHVKDVARMRTFELSIDRKPFGRIRADGIVVSTPTGSTSYAMSAGGPAVDPQVEALVVTAIAPYAYTGRPLVVSPLKEISIRPVGVERACSVIVDGNYEEDLPEGASVHCYRSPRRTTLVRFSNQFFQRLRAKAILPWDRA